MDNIYYNPEKFDLIPFAELELREPDYSYDTVVVWRHTATKLLLWAHDSGCSCPTPFEDFTSVDELPSLETELDYLALENEVGYCEDRAAMRTFLRKVRRAMPRG